MPFLTRSVAFPEETAKLVIADGAVAITLGRLKIGFSTEWALDQMAQAWPETLAPPPEFRPQQNSSCSSSFADRQLDK